MGFWRVRVLQGDWEGCRDEQGGCGVFGGFRREEDMKTCLTCVYGELVTQWGVCPRRLTREMVKGKDSCWVSKGCLLVVEGRVV